MYPKQINKIKHTPRYTIMKWQNTKDKHKILKAAREKRHISYKGMIFRLTGEFSTAPRGTWHTKCSKKITVNLEVYQQLSRKRVK